MDWSARQRELLALDKAGRVEELKALLDELPRQVPDQLLPHLSYWRGKCAVVAEQFEDAIPLLAETVRLQPLRAHAHYLLGASLVRLSSWIDARHALERALELQPRHQPSAVELAKVYRALAEHRACADLLAPFMEGSADDTALHTQYWRAVVMAESDHVEAAAHVAKALLSGGTVSVQLRQDWLKIAGGFLVCTCFEDARHWFNALHQQPVGVAGCADPLPGRFALVGRLILNLIEPDQQVQLSVLIDKLRSLVWLPFTKAEEECWHEWLEPSLWILVDQLEQYPQRLTSAAKEYIAAMIVSLRSFLGHQLYDSEVLRSLDDLAEGCQRIGHFDKAKILARSDFLEQSLNACHSVNGLQARLRWLVNCDDRILHENRAIIEAALSRLSGMVFNHSNRLVVHTDPTLTLRALQMREEVLDFLWEASLRLMSLTKNCPRHHRPLRRWLLLATDDLPQCFLYRVQQKQEQLQAIGCECQIVMREQLNDFGWSEQLIWADALMVCRLPAFYEVLRAIAMSRHAGLPVFYDIDDLIIDPDFSPPEFSTYGGTLSEEQHRRFILDVPYFANVASVCDEVVVSTKTLADRWSTLQKRKGRSQPVRILPNLAPPELRREFKAPAQARLEDPIRLVFASGTKAHKQVWSTELAPALAIILERYPNVRLDLIGHLSLPTTLQAFSSRIRCRPYTDYQQYIEQLSKADIGLVVLESGTFTDAKSAIRWMEFSYLGLCSILSPTKTYTDILVEGVHALFAQSALQWMDRIETLINDPVMRLNMAQKAQEHARSLFDPHQGEKFWTHLNQPAVIQSQVIRRRKLLIINVFFAPQSIGGATRIAQDHVRELQHHLSDQYDITVLCSDHQPWQTSSEEELIPLQIHDWFGARVVRFGLPGKPWSWHHDGSVERVCREWFRRERFDVIHAHSVQVLSAAPLKVAKELDIPYLISLHDAWWLSPSQFLTTRLGKAVNPSSPHAHHDVAKRLLTDDQIKADIERQQDLREILADAHKRLAVSQAFATLHENLGVEDVQVMENIPQSMAAESLSPRHKNHELRCCFVGGMALHKGFAVLQAAITQWKPSAGKPQINLTVVDSSLGLDNEYSINWGEVIVSFVPKIEMSKMAEFYANQDVLIAPSIWPESYGLVTREALSAGLWVIASDIGALAEPILHGKNGFRIPANDPKALLTAIHEIPNKWSNIYRLTSASSSSHIPLWQQLDQTYSSSIQ